MISGKAFVIGAIIFILAMFMYSLMKTSSECDRKEEANRWEEEHTKERDGSGV